jgi:RHS repeat-associated protein
VYDEESGLYYLRARYMDPSTGTFTSMDSYEGRMSDPDSLHKYLYANANPVVYKDPSGHTSVAEQACATAIMAVVSQRYTICLAGLMGAIFGAAVSPLLKGNANAEDHMLKSMISGFIMGAGISAIGFISAAVFSISLIHFYITVALISTTAEYVEALYCMSQGKTKEYFVHLSLSLISFVGFSKLYNMPDVFPSMGKGKISKYANAVEDR